MTRKVTVSTQQVIFFLDVKINQKAAKLNGLKRCSENDLHIQTAGNPGKESASRPPNLNITP